MLHDSTLYNYCRDSAAVKGNWNNSGWGQFMDGDRKIQVRCSKNIPTVSFNKKERFVYLPKNIVLQDDNYVIFWLMWAIIGLHHSKETEPHELTFFTRVDKSAISYMAQYSNISEYDLTGIVMRGLELDRIDILTHLLYPKAHDANNQEVNSNIGWQPLRHKNNFNKRRFEVAKEHIREIFKTRRAPQSVSPFTIHVVPEKTLLTIDTFSFIEKLRILFGKHVHIGLKKQNSQIAMNVKVWPLFYKETEKEIATLVT